MTNKVLFARQPIFNRKMQVFAYELLCRNPALDLQTSHGQDEASSGVLMHAFNDLSIEQVVGQHKAFINFTENLLQAPPMFGKQQLVIEVLESVLANDLAMASLGQLRAQGYTVALDDFELSKDSAPLLEYAHIVKLDVLALSEKQLISHVEQLKPLKIELLAEKVETYEMLELCKSLGFDYFQGYFLARPKNIKGKASTENRAVLLRLLAEIHCPDIDMKKMESIVGQDPILSYKLLKLINSAAFHLVRKIESLRDAMTLLGLEQIKRWATLLSLAGACEKPTELCSTTLIRAHMCQVIGEQTIGHDKANICFTAGLFSTLDAFLDSPMEEVMQTIPLSDELQAAILSKEGEVGEILNQVILYEQGQWSQLSGHYDEDLLSSAYTESLLWVTDALEGVVFS